MQEITQEYLKAHLHYDPITGIMKWTQSNGCNARRLKRGYAGSTLPTGYKQIKLQGKFYYVHRLAFLYMHGYMPRVVDHINGEVADNRWINLRPVSHIQNLWNSVSSHSNAGYRGVSKSGKSYRARIGCNNAVLHLGTFTSPEEAAAAYQRKAKELYGEHYADR